tara:strand:+ start:165 stop:332 length:168 start_codon:yes stop_codon:yes gene_type:complete
MKVTEEEKDAALSVLGEYIAQEDINLVGGLFDNSDHGDFVVVYGKGTHIMDKLKK